MIASRCSVDTSAAVNSQLSTQLTFDIKNNPPIPKNRLGNHAPSHDGTHPVSPKVRPSCCKTKYVKKMKMLAATPTNIFRRPDRAENGMATITTTRQANGPANRPCNLVKSQLRIFRSGCG